MTVMFRPTPSTITDTGYVACSCAPARNSGLRGPGTFEITRFTGGRGRPRSRLVVGAAGGATAGGVEAGAPGGRVARRAPGRPPALRGSSRGGARRGVARAPPVG